MDWNTIAPGCIVDGVATLQCLPAVFKNVVSAALVFAGATTIAFIIIAGFKLMNSGGDPKKVESARATLTFAIIGLVLILLSFFILNFIRFVTGVNCINIEAVGFNTCM